jgi:hypothetical protein
MPQRWSSASEITGMDYKERLPVQVDTMGSGPDTLSIEAVLEVDWVATIP